MIYFFDSSSIVKLYIEETGSDWVRKIFDNYPTPHLWISRIAGPEVTSALTRRFRSDDLDKENYQNCLEYFELEYAQNFSRTDVTPDILQSAMILIKRHNLRSYDGVQLASALSVNRDSERELNQTVTFISADNQLCTAAEMEGLIVENPNDHP